jgi:hypothetical protein
MSHFSPDPEIRLRQKYESNRPFEDSLFVEADRVSCGSTEGRAIPLSGDAVADLTSASNRAADERRFANRSENQAGGVSCDWESASANSPEGFTVCGSSEGIRPPFVTAHKSVEYSDDVCANKHKGAETSIAAHQRIAATSSELRQQIYSFALTSGERGITVKDVVERLKIVINTAAPRLSEMKRDGLLQIKGNERRDGCAVLIPRYATR